MPQIGNYNDALAALDIHMRTWPQSSREEIGSTDWTRSQGATRAVYRRKEGTVVYKIEIAYHGGNEVENSYASRLLEMGRSWAPSTSLYRCDTSRVQILAMPYYPFAVRSQTEVPDEALRVVGDQLLANFRRTEEAPEGQVKVIDLADYTPEIEALLRTKYS